MLLDLKKALADNQDNDETMRELLDFEVECHCCGAKFRNSENKLTTVCSAFGGYSVALCGDCLSEQKEPYGHMVASICIAGGINFPEGINDFYVKEVRRQLKLHNKTEEEFVEDVRQCDFEMSEALSFPSYSDKFDDEEGDFF